jgi:hypothetical protein
MVRDCFDFNSGKRLHGEQWVDNASWKVKCDNGTKTIIACLGSSRINYEEIPIGETKVIDNFWYKCEQDGDDIRYKQEPSCMVNGELLHVNDTFRNGAFKMQCESWGYSLQGCYYYADNGDLKELAIGESAVEGVMKHSCEYLDGSSSSRVIYLMNAVACKKNGVVHQENETWVEGNLGFKCLSNGQYIITGCVTPTGKNIDVGKDLIEDNFVHRCYRIGAVTYYHGYVCGVSGVSCEPKPMPHSNADVVVNEGSASVSTQLLPSGGASFSNSAATSVSFMGTGNGGSMRRVSGDERCAPWKTDS